jgi:hypothetical protein
MIRAWGRDNPWVRVNVLGQFPQRAWNTLLGPEEVLEAQKRDWDEDIYRDEPLVAGLDVARSIGGDRSVLFPRQGRVAYRLMIWRGLDTMDLAAEVARWIDKNDPDLVSIDATGIGAGVYDRLAQLGYPQIEEIHFGSKAQDEVRFANRRAELWWTLSDWVRERGSLPDVPELVAELSAPTYRYNAQDRLVLEPKEEVKERLQASPDLADALALTFATKVVSRRARGVYGEEAVTKAVRDWDPFKRAGII